MPPELSPADGDGTSPAWTVHPPGSVAPFARGAGWRLASPAPHFGATWLAGTRCYLDTSLFETDSGLAAASTKKTGPRSYFLAGAGGVPSALPGVIEPSRGRPLDCRSASDSASRTPTPPDTPRLTSVQWVYRHVRQSSLPLCVTAFAATRAGHRARRTRAARSGKRRPDHGIIAGGLLRVHPWVSLGFSRGLGEERAH